MNREMGQENLTGPEIAAVWIGSLLALAGFINTLGAAWEKLHKAIGAAKAPDREQDARITALEQDMKNVKSMLGNDKQALNKINDGLCVSFQAQLALIDNALNGNNVEQMQRARDALHAHLTNPNK